ncbi:MULTISPECIES: bifunctional metallophosphatase/5'-nucleotidase [Cohnella]|uniref:bifunctional metallophosphatase/5'-nucleotidase n=1 Tax=Cohnella TaxID=329857 RepID=UPI001F0807ED|nr:MULTISPECIES: bifunctional UDP-sugar hydrolase/5'-nucleotidase [Cohnella]
MVGNGEVFRLNSPSTATTATATLLFTSDIHGHIFPTDYRGPGERNLGLAKLATVIRAERERDPSLLLLDNGDLIQGTPFMYHYAKYDRQGEHPAARALNFLRYDAAVPGNHEFNYGLDLFRQVAADSDCPWLSANIVGRDGEPAFGKPYLVRETEEGVRIAILGLTTHYVPNWEHPDNITGLAFEDALSSARRWVAHIRATEKPDAVVVCYHGGFERDLETGEETEPQTGENQGFAMCRELEGVDVLLTGHQHRTLAGELHGVTIAQPGSAGQAIAKVRIEFERDEAGNWSVAAKRAEIIEADDATPADPELLAMFAEDERKTQEWLDQPIGKAEGNMAIPDPFAARLADHAFTEFVNRVQMETTGAAVSCAAIFTDEARGFGERITMRDIVSNYIYPNTLKVLLLSGRDIKAGLEKSACYFMLEEGDGDGRQVRICPAYLAPKPQHFNYDMWEGIEYELDISRPEGQRVVKLNQGGKPLDPDGAYEVVMNSYRSGGGGNFDMFRGKPVVREVPTDMTEIMADYISARKTIRATCDGNWKVTY